MSPIDLIARTDLAAALADYIGRHPASHITLRERVHLLAQVPDEELDLLVPEVERFLQRQKGRAA